MVIIGRTSKTHKEVGTMDFPHGTLEGRSSQEHINTRWRISDNVIIFAMELETCLIVLNKWTLKSWELGGTPQCMISA